MAAVNYRVEGRVALIGLNRPEKLNAINDDLRRDLRAALDEFAADDARVAILYGEGRAFSVGMDLSPHDRYVRMTDDYTAASDRDRIHGIADDWMRVFDHPKPIIAQVHGYAIAGGTQLALACDFISIAHDTILGWPKLPVGAGWVSPMWSTAIGVQRAKYMSYRVGSTMTGEQAVEWGYAAVGFDPAEHAVRTREIADEIAKVPSDVLRLKKLANNRMLERRGFREAAYAGAEFDAITHETQAVKTAQAWIREEGLSAAITRFAADGM